MDRSYERREKEKKKWESEGEDEEDTGCLRKNERSTRCSGKKRPTFGDDEFWAALWKYWRRVEQRERFLLLLLLLPSQTRESRGGGR